MSSVKYTEAQQRVIDNRDSNLLVSAAAGSGKTAVLVEHIISMIMDEENPVDIDRLMVVTFTNAAAGEMRERIMAAIEKALEKNSSNRHLQKQMSYIHNARITTLHSFCLNLVREHFNMIDIDPGFRIGDTGELSLMKSDIVKDVIEEFYASEREDFHEFIEQVSPKGKDGAVEEMILNLYDMAMSTPEPEKFIRECVEIYDWDEEKINNSSHMKVMCDYMDSMLKECLESCEKALRIIALDDGPSVYEDAVKSDKVQLDYIMSKEDFGEKCSALEKFEFMKLSSKRDGSDPDKRTYVKNIRESVKKDIQSVQKSFAGFDKDKNACIIGKLKDAAHAYGDVTIAFLNRYAEKKKEKNLVDFNDFEHFALKILMEKKDGVMVPSKIADEIAGTIDEVIVDEYQDINQVQDTILKCLSTERFGRPDTFMVGDVKQSIYGFRMAEPDLFVEKYNRYKSDSTSPDRKIILEKNFRSRPEVLDSVNHVFRKIMYREFGGIEYDDENALYPGASYPQVPETRSAKTEILLAEVPKEISGDMDEDGTFAGMNRKEIEARMVALKIREMTDAENGYMITDKKTGMLRVAQYSDILILFRNPGTNADIMVEGLESQGIPAYYECKTGYFDTLEVNDILSYLNIIDNPIQDIPLAASMTSVFGGFTDYEMAVIRAAGNKEGKKESLYNNVLEYSLIDNELGKKADGFLNRLEHYRDMAEYTSIYELITCIIEESGYDDYVLAMPAGDRRAANIEMLKEKAIDYEKTSYKGLFNFVRYIEKIRKYEIESGEASVVSENENAVSIMSIHKSKGLEYPIVFICNMNGKMNDTDIKKSVCIHRQLGVGFDYIDSETRVKTASVYKNAIKILQKMQMKQEEMRVLYVGMTRAKEKLIMTGSGIAQKKLEEYENIDTDISKKVNKAKLIAAGSLLEDVCMACGTGCDSISVNMVPFENIVSGAVKESVIEKQSEANLRNWDSSYVYDEDMKKKCDMAVQYVYPHMDAVLHNAKVSVSELKHKKMDILFEEKDYEPVYSESDIEEIIPEFIKGIDIGESKYLSGAERGTAYHRIFELFDYTIEPVYENVKSMIGDMIEKGLIEKNMADAVRIKDMVAFAKSDLGMRMRKAFERGDLYREAQFVMGVDGRSLGEDIRDMVLVQGIVDAYFYENDQIVIVDYKTDRVNDEQELVEKYREQLIQYKTALEGITGKKVKDMILYSVCLTKEISIEKRNVK